MPKLALAFLIGLPAVAQQYPQTGGPAMSATRDPAEANAYASAVAVPDLQLRAAALRAFLNTYPNSNLRQPAMGQLMDALRQTRGMPPLTGDHNPPQQLAAATPPAAAPAPAATTPSYSGVPDSLLTQSPKQPQVTIASNELSIKADNSTLSSILNQVAHETGMKVDGLSKDQRVFGSYGPGEPREVLSALLDGSGYNVVMVGANADGAPRQLSLTPRTQGSSASASSQPQPSQDAEGPDDSDDDIQQVPPEPPTSQPIQPIPLNQPTPDGNQQPRTPQQIIQELQRMRQQQEQNQQQQQQ